MLQDKNAELMAVIEEKTKKEDKLNKKIEQQRESLKEWEKNSRQVYKELKRNEILQEKERYEMLLQLKQMKNKIAEYQVEINDQKKQIDRFKLEDNMAQTKAQLANLHGSNSFISGSNVTPDRTVKDSQQATNLNTAE